MRLSGISFSKYEGIGNDFILVEGASTTAISAESARALCDRRFGIGADGVLVIHAAVTPLAAASMRVLNADGSTPEMCGNGLRCAALHLARETSHRALVIDTDAGPRSCVVETDSEGSIVEVDMGEVRPHGSARLIIGGETVEVLLADAGNPHAILFGDFSRDDVHRLGPQIERSAAFERGTNVEFAQVRDGGIDLVVWERGVGVTLGCGTGACAVAVVARQRELIAPRGAVKVSLPGGTLTVDPVVNGHTTMRGPVRRVFTGVT